MRLFGLSRICLSVLSLSLAVLLAGCLPPTAKRKGPDNSTSIDPALAFDNPAGGTTRPENQASRNTPAWGDPKFPNQPLEEFLTPMQPPDDTDFVADQEPSDEHGVLDLDLDLTLGAGEPELEPPEPELSPDGLTEEDADSADAQPSETASPDRGADDDPLDKKAFGDLYPDVDLPENVDGSAANP